MNTLMITWPLLGNDAAPAIPLNTPLRMAKVAPAAANTPAPAPAMNRRRVSATGTVRSVGAGGGRSSGRSSMGRDPLLIGASSRHDRTSAGLRFRLRHGQG